MRNGLDINLKSYLPNILFGLCVLALIGSLFVQNEQGLTIKYPYFLHSVQIDQLLNEIEKAEIYNPPSAFKKAKSLIDLAEEKGDELALAQAYFYLAKIKLVENKTGEDYITALSYAKIANQVIVHTKDLYWQARINNLLANIFTVSGELDSVKYYSQQAFYQLGLFNKDRNDSLFLAAELLKVKSVYLYLSDIGSKEGRVSDRTFLEMIHTLRESLGNYREVNYLEGEGICLRNIGIMWSQKPDLEKAILFLDSALAVNIKMDSDIAEHETLREQGKCYISQAIKVKSIDKLQIGISNYRRALELDDVEKANTLLHIGLAYHNALFYLQDSTSEDKKANYLDSASYYYLSGIENAKKELNLIVLQQLTGNYASICDDLPYPRDCASFIEKSNDAYYEIASATKRSNIDAVDSLHAYKRKLISQEGAKQRLSIILISTALILLTFAAFMYYFERLRWIFLRKQLAIRLAMLQAQMNPHFISNSLNAIESLINLKQNREASEYLVKFSHMARMILDLSQQDFISLAQEIEILNYYLDLEGLRMGDKLSYSITIEKDLDKEQITIPPMLIQPLVENAIWHGIKPKVGKGTVSIQFLKETDQTLICVVEDDGIGREKAKELKLESSFPKISHSTRIIEERLEILKAQKGKDLRITDLTDGDNIASGTKAELFIQYKNNISNK